MAPQDPRHPLAVTFASLANGTAEAQFQHQLKKVLENIRDPNAPAHKARTIKITMKLTPNEKRNEASIVIESSCTLVATKPADSHLFIGEHLGVVQALEHNPDQMKLFEPRPAPVAVNFPQGGGSMPSTPQERDQ